MPEEFNLNRRRFVGTTAITIAAAQLGMFGYAESHEPGQGSSQRSSTVAQTMASSDTTSIRPFPHVNVPESDLDDLRRRIKATRWPTKELVPDDSQGVQLAMTQALATYWATDYDWRKCEAKLNATPQFVTEIDGQEIQFIHVRSKHDNALPLIITHGWPGSIIEQMKVIGPLTNPTAHGASASDAFDVVIP